MKTDDKLSSPLRTVSGTKQSPLRVLGQISPALVKETSSRTHSKQNTPQFQKSNQFLDENNKENSPTSVIMFPNISEINENNSLSPVLKENTKSLEIGSSILDKESNAVEPEVDLAQEFKKKEKHIENVLRSLKESKQTSVALDCEISDKAFEDIAKALVEYSKYRDIGSISYSEGEKELKHVHNYHSLYKRLPKDNHRDEDVGINYHKIHSAINQYASEAVKNKDMGALIAFGALRKDLGLLKSDQCNQQNAQTFAGLLNKFSPKHKVNER